MELHTKTYSKCLKGLDAEQELGIIYLVEPIGLKTPVKRIGYKHASQQRLESRTVVKSRKSSPTTSETGTGVGCKFCSSTRNRGFQRVRRCAALLRVRSPGSHDGLRFLIKTPGFTRQS